MLTAEQKAQRKGKITSSVAGACLGLSEYMSPLQAWREILGFRTWDGNKATERGDLLERVVIDYASSKIKLEPTRAPFVDREWRGDSADGLLYKCEWDSGRMALETNPCAVVEAKTVALGGAKGWGREGTGDIPAGYIVQCYWHLLHWPTAERCYVPALFGGHSFEFRLYVVERDDKAIAKLESILHEWWKRHIEGEEPPDANHLDHGELSEMFPRDDGRSLNDNEDVQAHAMSYLQARDAEATERKRKDYHGNRLRQLLGDHSECAGDWGSVQWRPDKNGVRSLRVKER
jgi:predicted phage-related endonuclease